MDIFTHMFTSPKIFGNRNVMPPNNRRSTRKHPVLLHETNLSKVDITYKPMISPRENNKNNKNNKK